MMDFFVKFAQLFELFIIFGDVPFYAVGLCQVRCGFVCTNTSDRCRCG
jgi:hypothetical protein